MLKLKSIKFLLLGAILVTLVGCNETEINVGPSPGAADAGSLSGEADPEQGFETEERNFIKEE